MANQEIFQDGAAMLNAGNLREPGSASASPHRRRVAQVRPRTAGTSAVPGTLTDMPGRQPGQSRNVRRRTRSRYPHVIERTPALKTAWRHPSSLSWEVAGMKHKPPRKKGTKHKPTMETLSSNPAGNHSRTESLTSHRIIALEKRETRPEDPWSSQGGGRIMEAPFGNYAWTTET